jgi:sugar phosphate isomerase/epimerase
MELGVCAPIDHATTVLAAGADYIELNCATSLMPDDDDAAWQPMSERLRSLPLPVRAFNVFMARGKIIGPEADLERLQRYADRAAQRCAAVGGAVIVLGSGRARNAPDGMAAVTAISQFKRFLEYCAQAGRRHGIVFVVEPLNRTESNLINTLASGAELVSATRSSHVRLLADSYHMEQENETVGEITRHGALIKHVHTADTARVRPGRGAYDHVALARVLRSAGYTGRLSIESMWDDFEEEVGPAIAHLRRAFA